jgi:tetratricopeptide (TPR) repeat protein
MIERRDAKGVSITGGQTNVVGDLVGGDKHFHQAPTPVNAALHQLPPPPDDFTGRTKELERLHAAIEKDGFHISGLQGQGGVGKTALALKLAEELAFDYPDAQIYLDLKGISEKPLTVAEAMSHVLRSFNLQEKVPDSEDELRGRYRTVLHSKRSLLLMDNAKDANQVRPLIPHRGCALIVTSRMHFTLPGLRAENLETLPPQDAEELLLRIAPRIGSESGPISRLCGYLPLALRLAASALAVRIDLSPQDYSGQLSVEKNRLKLLANEEESVEASITLSYRLLTSGAQKLWRALAVFPGAFDVSAAAFVWKIETSLARQALSALLRFSMLEWNDAAKRYRLHDLMRDFANARIEPLERAEAHMRHAMHYFTILRDANTLFETGGTSILSGLGLFDMEWANIQSGQSWAVRHRVDDRRTAQLCSDFPDWGCYILALRLHPREQIHWRKAALLAAESLKDRTAEARHLSNLGEALTVLGEYPQAIPYCEKALLFTREVGDRRSEANVLGNLGNVYKEMGDTDHALQFFEQSLVIAREVGDQRGEGATLGNLGVLSKDRGDFSRAIEYHNQRLTIARKIGDRRGEGNALGNLGITYCAQGNHRRGIESFQNQLAITHEIGDKRGEGVALINRGKAFDSLGDREKAIQDAEAALRIFEEIEHPSRDSVKQLLNEWRRESK